MNIVQRSLICLTLLSSFLSLIQGSTCPNINEDQIVFLSDFAPDPEVEGTNFGYTPFELIDQTRSTSTQRFVKGFDVEVATEVAKRIKLTDVSFKQECFESILGKIDGSIINVAIAAISTTQQRKDDFSNVEFIIYNDDPMAIILPTALVKDNPCLQNPNTVLQELNTIAVTAGNIKIATLLGSRQITILNSLIYDKLDPLVFNDLSEAIQDLQEGDVSGLFTDKPVANDIIDSLPGFTVIEPVPVDVARDLNLAEQTSAGLGILVNKGCSTLISQIQSAITDMENDGTLAALRARLVNENDIDNFLFDKHCAVVLPVIDNDTAPEVDGA